MRRKARSGGEEAFALQCRALRLPTPVREHMFAAESHGRLWRFDFSWAAYRVAVEINGLIVRYVKGRKIVTGGHATVEGIERDNIKFATAQILGWGVLTFNQRLITNGTAIDLTMQLLKARGWQA
jgi:hypothetical protein